MAGGGILAVASASYLLQLGLIVIFGIGAFNFLAGIIIRLLSIAKSRAIVRLVT